MKSTLGIRTHLIAGIIVITLAALGFLGVLSIKAVAANAMYRKVREAESMAKLLRAATIEAPWSSERSRVVDYVKRVMNSGGVYAIELVGADGRVLVKRGEVPGPDESRGSILYYERGINIRSLGESGWFGNFPAFLYVTVGPSTFSPPNASGAKLTFIVSMSDISEDLVRVTRFMIIYAVVDSLIIIAFGTVFFSRAIISPIKRLESTAARIAAGELDERAIVTVDNEIGRLAGAFNTMAGRLEDEIKRLGRANRELVEAQQRLLRSSTLAAVGRLAAGLAHEIGNPLGAVQGYLDILSKGLGDREEESEIIKRSEREVSRINTIVREFLDFSRTPKKAPGPADVNALIEDTVSMMAGDKAFEGVKVELLLNKDIPPVIIDEGKFRQVVINLLVNGSDAMEGSGEIIVKTGSIVRRDDAPQGASRRRGDPADMGSFTHLRGREFVVISFRDNGSGIGPDELNKIFDPFYTTKVEGKGTGLGLFVSEGIIKTYGGMIEVLSEPRVGTTFNVTLPVA